MKIAVSPAVVSPPAGASIASASTAPVLEATATGTAQKIAIAITTMADIVFMLSKNLVDNGVDACLVGLYINGWPAVGKNAHSDRAAYGRGAYATDDDGAGARGRAA